MIVIASTGNPDHAVVYIMEMDGGRCVECVESVQPPIPRSDKWVLLVSTLFGCPVGCPMCDAGGFYQGKLSTADMFRQIDFLVDQRYPGRRIPCRQFKIQFARMGEPALNPSVLDVLEHLPARYDAPGLMPSISSVAPLKSGPFFNHLIDIKDRLYFDGRFQLQFSIHTTDEKLRKIVTPAACMSFDALAEYSRIFFKPGDRKITLNFALAHNVPVQPSVLSKYFPPDIFLIKITPLNPTYRAVASGLLSLIDPAGSDAGCDELVADLKRHGYDVIVSIGNTEENFIGSNCGQYLRSHLTATAPPPANGYSYPVQPACKVK